MTTALLLLALAVALEVTSTALLPRTHGFSHIGWTIVVLGGYAAAIWLLAVIVRTIPVSIAYAIWAGAGTALVAVIGYLVLGEDMTWTKALCLALIVIGVVGLNLSGSAHAA